MPRTDNNFHLVRLILALMVVACHAVQLSGEPSWQSMDAGFGVAAELGVQGFFVVSGYLVWSSLARSASLAVYAEKRARRLLPAYILVILLCVLAALVFSAQARADLAGVARYLGWNLIFLGSVESELPGLFEDNRYATVNGSLWTLKVEVMFYVVLPVLAWMMRIAGKYRWLLLACVYVAAEIWRQGLTHASTESESLLISLSRQLPGWMSYFAVGIALAAWSRDIRWGPALPIAGVVMLVAALAFPPLEFLRALGIGIVCIWVAVGIPPLFDVARFGDFSYGLYILHFPVIQGVAAVGLFALSPWLGLTTAVALAVGGAALLWWFVEKPALRADSAYRAEPAVERA